MSFAFFFFIIFLASSALTYRAVRFDKIYPNPLDNENVIITPKSACLEKPSTGPCKAYFEKFFYNQESKKCEIFTWGGCQGNVPFDSFNDCSVSCEVE